jgi:hypothetical protein
VNKTIRSERLLEKESFYDSVFEESTALKNEIATIDRELFETHLEISRTKHMRDTYPNISYVREALLKSNASLLEDRGSGFENVYHQPTFERLYLGSSKSNGKRMYQFLSVSHIKSCLLDVLIGGASKDFSSLSEASIDSLSGELALQQQLLSF